MGRNISIHALLAESDADSLTDDVSTGGFLSTLSLRRATNLNMSCSAVKSYFYPRSPCGERHTWTRGSRITYVISIHALLAESDEPIGTLRTVSVNFYPRSPCGERRQAQSLKIASLCISIHALLAESDHFINPDVSYNIISIHALLAESDASQTNLPRKN